MASNNRGCNHSSSSTPCEGCRAVAHIGVWADTPTRPATMEDLYKDLSVAGGSIENTGPSTSMQYQSTPARQYDNPSVSWPTYGTTAAIYNGSTARATDAAHGGCAANYGQFSQSGGYSTRAESVPDPARGQGVSLHRVALGHTPQMQHRPLGAYAQSGGASPWNGSRNHTTSAANGAINQANTFEPNEEDEDA